MLLQNKLCAKVFSAIRWSIVRGVGQDHVRQKLLTQRFANVWISQLNL